MTHRTLKIRPAMTAIAAVIALSSTPLFAQDAPVAETATPVVTTPPAAVSDPLSPVAEAPTVTEPAAASPTRTTRARTTTTRTTRAQPTAPRASSAARAPAPAAVSAAPVAAPIAELPTPAAPVIAEPIAPPPAVAPVAQPSAIDNFLASDEAPIAGAAGLGILALTGAGLAMRRRRRRRLEAEDAQWQYEAEHSDSALAPAEIAEPQRAPVEPQPGYMPEQAEPAFVRAFAPAAVAAAPAAEAEVTPGEPGEPIDGPVTELPEGFDLSRFGPHVQAAYQGPTEDNPSLSLRHRLRRAAALDQLAEREAEDAPVAAGSVEAPAAPQHDKSDFMLARSGTKLDERPASITNGRPAFSK